MDRIEEIRKIAGIRQVVEMQQEGLPVHFTIEDVICLLTKIDRLQKEIEGNYELSSYMALHQKWETLQAELAASKRGYVKQEEAAKLLIMLEGRGFGKAGMSNTLSGMVRDCIAENATLREKLKPVEEMQYGH